MKTINFSAKNNPRISYLLDLVNYYYICVAILLFILGIGLYKETLLLITFILILLLLIAILLGQFKFILFPVFFALGIYLGMSGNEVPVYDLSNFQDLIKEDVAKLLVLEDGNGKGKEVYTTKCISISGVECEGKVNLSLYNTRLSYGDLVRVSEFTFSKYSEQHESFYTLKGIYSELQSNSIEIIATNQGNLFVGVVNKFRSVVNDNINTLYPEPEASLLVGLLIGKSDNLDYNLKKEMVASGTIHIIVASGYNVSVVLAVVAGLVKGVSRWLRIVLSLVVIPVIIVLMGAEPPIVRAALMSSVPILIGFAGFRANKFVTFLLVCFIMLIAAPMTLFSMSFQLSFLATAGIFLFYDYFNEKLSNFRLSEIITTTLASAIAAQILVMPLISYSFKTINLVSIGSNLLILEFIPLIMFLGVISVLFAVIISPSFNLFYIVNYWLLGYVVDVIKLFSFEGSQRDIFNLDSRFLILIYLALMLFAFNIAQEIKIKIQNKLDFAKANVE